MFGLLPIWFVCLLSNCQCSFALFAWSFTRLPNTISCARSEAWSSTLINISNFYSFLFFAGIFEGRAWNRLTLWLKLPNQGFMTYDVWGVLNLLFIWGQTSQQLSITNSYSSKFSNVKSLKHACHFYFFLLFSKILWFFFHRSFKAYFKVNLDIYQPHWFTFFMSGDGI